MPKDEGPPRVKDGLRERNKREKLERILAAAREAFGNDGYEATTLRQVAAAAGVAVGTIFLYAPTKEDLLVLVFRRELEPVVDQSFEQIPEASLLQQLLFVFGGVIQHHSENMRLSRPFLREMAFLNGDQVKDVDDFMARWGARIVGLFEKAKARKELSPDADSRLLSLCSLQLFIGGLREWVAGRATRAGFEAVLASMLGALLTGFLIVPGAGPTDGRAPAKPRSGLPGPK